MNEKTISKVMSELGKRSVAKRRERGELMEQMKKLSLAKAAKKALQSSDGSDTM